MVSERGDSSEFGPSMQEVSRQAPSGRETPFEGVDSPLSAEFRYSEPSERTDVRSMSYGASAAGMLRRSPTARRVTFPGSVGVSAEVQRAPIEEVQTTDGPAANTDEAPSYEQGDLFDLLPTPEVVEPDQVADHHEVDRGVAFSEQRPAEVVEVPMSRYERYQLEESQERHTGELLKVTAEAFEEADANFRAEWDNFALQLGGHTVHRLEKPWPDTVRAEWYFDIHDPAPDFKPGTPDSSYIKVTMQHGGYIDEPLPDELAKAIDWLANQSGMSDKEVSRTPLLGVEPYKVQRGGHAYDVATLASRVGEALPEYIKSAVVEYYDHKAEGGPRTHKTEVGQYRLWDDIKTQMEAVSEGRGRSVAESVLFELRIIAQRASGNYEDMTAYPDDATVKEFLFDRYLKQKLEDFKEIQEAIKLLSADNMVTRGYVVPEPK